MVYGQPAIAVPVQQLQATATIEPALPRSGLTLIATDLERTVRLADAPADDPLAAMVRLTLTYLGVSPPDAVLIIRSSIPIASGLGSGTAVSTAIVRALAAYLGHELAAETVSRLVFEVEKMHHGTPSGIDNTVVVYGMPVYFVRGKTIETFRVGTPLHLLIGDTGVASPTRLAVNDVRRAWETDKMRYERLFRQIGGVVGRARALIENGKSAPQLGELMNRNHQLLHDMRVSSLPLESLVTAARAAGAMGAKLSGAGRGGNMIALVAPAEAQRVSEALHDAGAVRVIETVVSASAAAHEQ